MLDYLTRGIDDGDHLPVDGKPMAETELDRLRREIAMLRGSNGG